MCWVARVHASVDADAPVDRGAFGRFLEWRCGVGREHYKAARTVVLHRVLLPIKTATPFKSRRPKQKGIPPAAWLGGEQEGDL